VKALRYSNSSSFAIAIFKGTVNFDKMLFSYSVQRPSFVRLVPDDEVACFRLFVMVAV